MVNVKILGILEEDTKLQMGNIKIGEASEILNLSAEEFLSGSIYDRVLEKVSLLGFIRNLTRIVVDKTKEQELDGSTITINIEEMCTNRITLDSLGNDKDDSLFLKIEELGLEDCYFSSEESGAYINGVIKENGKFITEVNIEITKNIGINLQNDDKDMMTITFDDGDMDFKEKGKMSDSEIVNAFAVGLAMKCEKITNNDSVKALTLLEEAYEFAKSIISND